MNKSFDWLERNPTLIHEEESESDGRLIKFKFIFVLFQLSDKWFGTRSIAVSTRTNQIMASKNHMGSRIDFFEPRVHIFNDETIMGWLYLILLIKY